MKEWYSDTDIGIFFNHKPNTNMLDPENGKTQKEKDLIARNPFVNNTSLIVILIDNIKEASYNFTIPKGFRWDGATIPSWIWCIVGSKTNPKFKNPSLIHDYMCNNKYIVNYNRNFSSKIFRGMLLKAGVNKIKANIMYKAVDLYQMTQGWGK